MYTQSMYGIAKLWLWMVLVPCVCFSRIACFMDGALH